MINRIFEIIEIANEKDKVSRFYDFMMMVVIVASIIPLAFKQDLPIFQWIDRITVTIFIIDYLLRWLTAEKKLGKGKISFFRYPFTFMAIVDLLSIAPSILMINSGLKVLKVFRLLRSFRVFRVFKAFRYSKNVTVLVQVFEKQKDSLMVVLWLAAGYILVSALVVFNVEPETFGNFFDAIYWATVSLTTVGYGDIYPTSIAGQIITMISALMGIAIVALPASIITAGYMEVVQKKDK